MKKILCCLQCHWTFLFIGQVALLYAVQFRSWEWCIIFGIVIVRVFMLKNRHTWLFVAIILLFGLRMWGNFSYVERQKIWEFPSDLQTYTVKVFPLNIKEGEASIRGKGELVIEKQSIQVEWRLPRRFIQEKIISLSKVQEWQVVAKIKRIEPSRNFYVFDYADYMEKQNIIWVVDISEILHQKDVVSVENVRSGMLSIFQRWNHLEWVALHNKLLWNLDSSTYQEYRITFSDMGVLHFFAISGFHVYAIRSLLRYFLRRIVFFVDIAEAILNFLLFFYAWCVGFPVGVIRVVGMLYAHEVVNKYQLPFSRFDQLAIIGSLSVLAQPSVGSSTGFVLSYLMAYVLYFFNQKHIATSSKLLNNIDMTASCLLFSLPIIVQQSHEFYPFQFIWIIIFTFLFEKIIFPFAIMTTLFMLLPLNSGVLFVRMMDTIFGYFYQFVAWLDNFQMKIIVGHLSTGWMLLLFVVAGVYLWLLSLNKKKAYTVVVLSYLCLFQVVPRIHDRIVMMDVGQGDALLFQPAWSTQSWLIDTGGSANRQRTPQQSLANPSYAHRTIIPALKALGVRELTGVIITHPDMDHLGNLQELAQHIPIRRIVATPYTQRDDLWLDMLQDFPQVTQIITMQHHDVIEDARIGMTLYTIPDVSDLPQMDSSNDTSIAAILTIGKLKLLTLGDLSAEGEKLLLKYYPEIQADIVKLGHHGSKHSTSDELLNHISPRWAWISAGKDNRYGHPHEDVLDKLNKYDIPYISTHEVGAVLIEESWWGNYKVKHVLKSNKK